MKVSVLKTLHHIADLSRRGREASNDVDWTKSRTRATSSRNRIGTCSLSKIRDTVERMFIGWAGARLLPDDQNRDARLVFNPAIMTHSMVCSRLQEFRNRHITGECPQAGGQDLDKQVAA